MSRADRILTAENVAAFEIRLAENVGPELLGVFGRCSRCGDIGREHHRHIGIDLIKSVAVEIQKIGGVVKQRLGCLEVIKLKNEIPAAKGVGIKRFVFVIHLLCAVKTDIGLIFYPGSACDRRLPPFGVFVQTDKHLDTNRFRCLEYCFEQLTAAVIKALRLFAYVKTVLEENAYNTVACVFEGPLKNKRVDTDVVHILQMRSHTVVGIALERAHLHKASAKRRIFRRADRRIVFYILARFV